MSVLPDVVPFAYSGFGMLVVLIVVCPTIVYWGIHCWKQGQNEEKNRSTGDGTTELTPAFDLLASRLDDQFIENPPKPHKMQPSQRLGNDIFCQMDAVLVSQDWKVFELLGVEARNTYKVFSPNGTLVYIVTEESDVTSRVCCGPNRELTFFLRDPNTNKILMRMHKPFHLQDCCCGCRPQLEVVGESRKDFIGNIEYPFTCCTMEQKGVRSDGSVAFETRGSFLQCGTFCGMCAPVDFEYFRNDAKVGSLSRKTLSLKNAFLDTDCFELHFGSEAGPTDRKLMFGALILAEMENYETPK